MAFGPMTKQAVLQFQRDHDLDDDGIVGAYTWRELLRPWAEEVGLSEPIKPPPVVILPPSDKTLNEQIYDIVGKSAIAKYPWKGRGVAPLGLSQRHGSGVCLAARTVAGRPLGRQSRWPRPTPTTTIRMHCLGTGSNFTAKGMSNATAGADTLRHCSCLCSDWECVKQADITARVGISALPTQQPTLLRVACSRCLGMLMRQANEISKLMDEYAEDEGLCFLGAFADGVQCSTSSWANYGTGKGHDFQKLAKQCPGFAVASAR